jgi:hypothetical protein
MGQLIIHQESHQLELSDFLLEGGDQVKILHLGSWLPGTVAGFPAGMVFSIIWQYRKFKSTYSFANRSHRSLDRALIKDLAQVCAAPHRRQG